MSVSGGPTGGTGVGRGTKASLWGALGLAAILAYASPASVSEESWAKQPAARPAQLVPSAPAARAAPAVSPQVATARRILDAQIDAIGQAFDGDVGIAVMDVQTGWTTDFDGRSHFPQQSVSKFWVSLTALDKADRGELSLHAPVTVHKSDLTLFNQPIAQKIGANGFTTTIDDLMRRALAQSDNTANDFILWRAGGPDAVRSFLRRKGIDGVRFGPGERDMQSRIAGLQWKQAYASGRAFFAARSSVPASVRRAAFEDYVRNPVDGATPLGTVDALAKLKRGELLSPASTARILGIMSNTRTGPRRLKGGLAPGWQLAHKTGTGQVLGSEQSGYNDIGIVTGPDGRSYAVAVLIRRTAAPVPDRMAMMQSVTRAVIDFDRNSEGFDIANRAHRPDSGTGSN